MAVTSGFQGVARFIEEATPGTTPTNPDFLLFSPETTSVTFGLNKNKQDSRDIGEIDVHEFYSVKDSYSVSVAFHVYDAARLLSYFYERNADETPKSFTLEIIPDQDAGTPHYWRGVGWRPGSVQLETSEDSPWTATITFVGGVLADPVTSDPGIGTGSRELKAAVSEDLKHFASAGITVDAAAVAVILNSFSVTVESNVAEHYTIGNREAVAEATTHAGRAITGSGDISLDDGAATHWARVKAFAEHEIIIPFGTTTGDPRLKLTGVKFPDIEVSLDTDQDILMTGANFEAKSLDATTTVP